MPEDYTKYLAWIEAYSNYPSHLFPSMAAWIKAIQNNVPPVNYDAWQSHSRDKLQTQLEDHFKAAKAILKRAPTPAKGASIIKDKSKRQLKSFARTVKAEGIYKRTKTPISKTRAKTLQSIEKKLIDQKPLNKRELKEMRTGVSKRASELVTRFGYKWPEALKRAWEEQGRN